MEMQSREDLNISLDSLEVVYDKKKNLRNEVKQSDEAIQTILVPFYDNDVLIKVPKKKKQLTDCKRKSGTDSRKRDSSLPTNYLVNKDQRSRRKTYLDIFRKQFTPDSGQRHIEDEMRSLSPQFGDTELESIGEYGNNRVTDFYNTEVYNEMIYERILNQELESLNNSFEEVQFSEKLSKCGDIDNMRSISEVTQQRRCRRATVQPIQSVKLGGLGPDMEKIKPRLDRARSLQRYSEKVRMENRLKIYKMSVEADIKKKTEKNLSARSKSRQREAQEKLKVEEKQKTSYLVNKTMTDNSKIVKNIFQIKYKSSGSKKSTKSIKKDSDDYIPDTPINGEEKQAVRVNTAKNRVASRTKDKKVNTDRVGVTETQPVHISFQVNVGGIRPSSALKNLEEQHRMYQEQVKAFKMDNNNN